MPRVNVMVEDVLVGQAHLDRVPGYSEQVVISAAETGSVWPAELRGESFHVGGLTTVIAANGASGEVRLNLLRRPR